MSSSRVQSYRTSVGFTLIEMMITVAVIAILSMIALPSYQAYVQRGRIVDATNALSATRARMEQFFQDNRSYNAAGSPCMTAQAAGQFTVQCTGAGNPAALTYTISATGGGFTFTINEQDLRQTTAAPAGWGTPPINCWVARKGGTCL
jgi:type IV pilus assembly protein PilE